MEQILRDESLHWMTDRLKVEGFQWQVTSISLIKWSPFEQEKLNWQSWIRNFFSTKEKKLCWLLWLVNYSLPGPGTTCFDKIKFEGSGVSRILSSTKGKRLKIEHWNRAAVVAQLAERSLLIPEVSGLNPTINIFIFLNFGLTPGSFIYLKPR